MLTDKDRAVIARWDTGNYVGVELPHFVQTLEGMSLSGLLHLRDRVTDARGEAQAELHDATERLLVAITKTRITDPRAPFIVDGETMLEAQR